MLLLQKQLSSSEALPSAQQVFQEYNVARTQQAPPSVVQMFVGSGARDFDSQADAARRVRSLNHNNPGLSPEVAQKYVPDIHLLLLWPACRTWVHLGRGQTAAFSSFAHNLVHVDWTTASLLALLDQVVALLRLQLVVHVGLASVLER